MQRTILGLIGLVLTAAAASAAAHHSHANYWESEWVELEGTVQEVHWLNPHTWINLQVADADGTLRAWALEAAGVSTLRRNGLMEDSVEIGDVLSVRCHPLKDGSRGCLLGFITLPDGTEREFD